MPSATGARGAADARRAGNIRCRGELVVGVQREPGAAQARVHAHHADLPYLRLQAGHRGVRAVRSGTRTACRRWRSGSSTSTGRCNRRERVRGGHPRLRGRRPARVPLTVHGDGSRPATSPCVGTVARACWRTPRSAACRDLDPVGLAFGSAASLNTLIAMIGEALGIAAGEPPSRASDVRDSQADNSRLRATCSRRRARAVGRRRPDHRQWFGRCPVPGLTWRTRAVGSTRLDLVAGLAVVAWLGWVIAAAASQGANHLTSPCIRPLVGVAGVVTGHLAARHAHAWHVPPHWPSLGLAPSSAT